MTTVSINSTHDSFHLKLHASESLIALFRNSQNSLATAISDVHAFCSFADHTAHKYNCAQVQWLITVTSSGPVMMM